MQIKSHLSCKCAKKVTFSLDGCLLILNAKGIEHELSYHSFVLRDLEYVSLTSPNDERGTEAGQGKALAVSGIWTWMGIGKRLTGT